MTDFDSATRAKRREDLLTRFERATELPLLVLAVVMIPLLLAPWLFELSESAEDVVTALDWLIWGVFAFEFAIRVG